MQVFNAFFKVLKKKIPSAMIYVIIFLAISMIMSGSSTSDTQFEATRLGVCIFDEDGTEASKALSDYIAQSHDIVKLENNKDEILDALFYTRADYVLTIRKGYADKLAAGDTGDLFSNYHVHDSYDSAFVDSMLNEYVRTVSAYVAGGAELSAAISSADEALTYETEVTIETFDNSGSSYENSGNSSKFGSYFQFLPYILISVMISALCPVLMTMNRREIRYRTNCSCIKISSQTMQIFSAAAVVITLIWLIFMIAGAIYSGEMYSGKSWIAVLNSFVFTLIAADIAILVSSFELSDNAVSIVNQILGLGMSFLCGVFVPLSLLGDGVIAAARFLPAYWYTRVNNMLSGVEVYNASAVAQFIAIEAAFAVVLAILTLLIRRLRYSGAKS